MTKKYFKSVKVTDKDGGGNFVIDYFICEDRFPIGEKMGVVTYGIEVVKKENGLKQTHCAPSLFTNYDDAAAFSDMLWRNSVTPVSMPAITEDYLASLSIEREKMKSSMFAVM